MSEIISMTGGEWTEQQVHRETGLLVPTAAVLAAAEKLDLEEVLVVGRYADGQLYIAGSHNTAYSALLAAQAQHVVIRTVELRD
jgi:hypothetical protein